MKKFLFLALAISCCSASSAMAQVDFFFSTSSTDPEAGSVLNIADGESGSLFVWVNNTDASGDDLVAVTLDISGSGDSSLMANIFNIQNPVDFVLSPPAARWDLQADSGTLGTSPGLLVDDSNSATLRGGGIRNAVGPVFFATLDLSAVDAGSNIVQLAEGNLQNAVGGQAPVSTNFGSATVNVTSVVPEPGSLAVIGMMVGGVFLRRRRA